MTNDTPLLPITALLSTSNHTSPRKRPHTAATTATAGCARQIQPPALLLSSPLRPSSPSPPFADACACASVAIVPTLASLLFPCSPTHSLSLLSSSPSSTCSPSLPPRACVRAQSPSLTLWTSLLRVRNLDKAQEGPVGLQLPDVELRVLLQAFRHLHSAACNVWSTT